ncbi:GNAT family N-acetyltransferase [Saccharibacillus sp. CPCC 101409]|uniref:GNAT family N-acetyltransferase n=1 Tax=Saccharibacillus sp. CPCC 101409 TaxID=3058041 RepID=UPI0026716F8B|nr:GNAT family N-acetyltransferase [Saccharibacillus sp. CPCC 101409]MDO3412166.1 GNAT family N-acetyltransferase [Saccharibacillus sp. CPCC 101409]
MSMDVELELVPESRKAVIERLLQFYLYDFTLYLNIAVDEEGRFPDYPDLHEFWTLPERKFPFLIRADGEIAGFALVERTDDGRKPSYYMVEFFVLQKFRRGGVGSRAATRLFERFRGRWKVTQLGNNEPAQRFWRNVIGTYTAGSYKERTHPFQGHPSQYFDS